MADGQVQNRCEKLEVYLGQKESQRKNKSKNILNNNGYKRGTEEIVWITLCTETLKTSEKCESKE